MAQQKKSKKKQVKNDNLLEARSNFRINSNNFSNNWVYYTRLKTDYGGKYEPLYSSISDRINSLLGIGESDRAEAEERTKAIAANIRSSANIERNKEKIVLERLMGEKVKTIKDFDKLDGAQLIQMFNLLLNSQDVFERNLQIIKNTKGVKNVASYFDQYLTDAFFDEKTINKIKEGMAKNFNDGSFSRVSEACQKTVKDLLPEIIALGFKKMAKAGVEWGVDPESKRLRNAYKELAQEIGKLKKMNNPYIRQIIQIYNLESAADELSSIIVKKSSLTAAEIKKESVDASKNFIVKDYRTSQQKAGYFMEIVGSILANMNRKKKVSYDGIDLQITGEMRATRLGGKAEYADDFVITLKNTSIDRAIQRIANKNNISADKISRVERLNQTVFEKLNDGLIIHVSAKNYALNSDFDGYHTTKMTPNSLDFVLNRANIHNENLISLIIQCCENSVGTSIPNYQEELQAQIAQYFAYMFFDDVKDIGTYDMRGQAIHMMYLNGIYLPLSVFLEELARAVEKTKTKDIVNIQISGSKQLYKSEKDDLAQTALGNNARKRWNEQRKEALEKTGITVQFFKNIKDFISGLNF